MIVEHRANLIAYIGRYTGFGWDECDRKTIRQLSKLADGIGEIIRAENSTDK